MLMAARTVNWLNVTAPAWREFTGSAILYCIPVRWLPKWLAECTGIPFLEPNIESNALAVELHVSHIAFYEIFYIKNQWTWL